MTYGHSGEVVLPIPVTRRPRSSLALACLLPKSGPWMAQLQQLLAFPLYASEASLICVVSQQTGPHGVAAAFAGLVLIVFAAWLHRALGGARALTGVAEDCLERLAQVLMSQWDTCPTEYTMIPVFSLRCALGISVPNDEEAG